MLPWRPAGLAPAWRAGRGSPWLRSKPELGARLFGMSPVTLSPMAAAKLP